MLLDNSVLPSLWQQFGEDPHMSGEEPYMGVMSHILFTICDKKRFKCLTKRGFEKGPFEKEIFHFVCVAA